MKKYTIMQITEVMSSPPYVFYNRDGQAIDVGYQFGRYVGFSFKYLPSYTKFAVNSIRAGIVHYLGYDIFVGEK